jgi:cytosine/adenosine deaminase-related metal-dependent hydrolase
MWQPAITLVNARVVVDRDAPGVSTDPAQASRGEACGTGAEPGTVRFTTRILSIGEPPARGDVLVDACGGFVLPGLINTHDHLELNHYGRLKFRDRYCNASEWIDDMRPRLERDAAICAGRSRPLADRLFIGVLKNLLSGVTTVVHHNPYYRELRRGTPIRILRRYGWAHSFDLEQRPAGAKGEPGGRIEERFRATPADVPFFVHIAEGIDARAQEELARLRAIGCLQSNSVLVHGVGIDAEGWRRIGRAGARVVWCPESNRFLFGQTIDPIRLNDSARPGGFVSGCDVGLALGTDSRLTGSCDLLDELRVADASAKIPRRQLLAMVTSAAADLIRQPQLGRVEPGAPADLIVVPPAGSTAADALLATARGDLRLVIVAGTPFVASDEFAPMFAARRLTPRAIHVDGVRRLVHPALAKRIADCAIAEPGVAA